MNPSTPGKMQLLRTMQRTIKSYGLIAKGDRIMVAVSGGKDSYTMLDLLCDAQKRAPFRFELVAVHLDQGQPGYDGKPLSDWLAGFGARCESFPGRWSSRVSQATKQAAAISLRARAFSQAMSKTVDLDSSSSIAS